MTLLRRVWRDQRGNQNPYIKEQTTQWRKEKVQKGKHQSTRHTYKAKGPVTEVPLKTGVNSRVYRSWSTSGTRRVDIVTNPIISHEWAKDRDVLTISGTYRWSLWHFYSIPVNQVMTVKVTFSKWWLHLYRKEPLIAVASVLAVSSSKEILIGATSSEISYHLRDIFALCRFCGNGATYKWKVHNGKI